MILKTSPPHSSLVIHLHNSNYGIKYGSAMQRGEKRSREELEELAHAQDSEERHVSLAARSADGAPRVIQKTSVQDWGDDDDDESSDAVCDVLAAIRLLRKEFPLCPFVLKSHVYTIVKDKTDADVQLDHLQRTNAIRIVHVPTEWDEGYVETAEYCKAIRDCMEVTTGRVRSVLGWFKDDVVPRHTGGNVTGEELKQGLSIAKGMKGKGVRRSVTEKDIDILIQKSLLQRSSQGERFVFTLPGSGQVVKSLLAGRRELLSVIKKKKYGQMLQSKIEQLTLKKSHLSIAWHVKDLIGSGVVHVEDTTVGPLIRVLQE